MNQPLPDPRGAGLSIWYFAFGYFACYAPYSALTKALSKGLLPGMSGPINGFVLLPVTVIASIVGMFIFISAMGWWKYAGHRTIGGVSLPMPGKYTLLSGLFTALIVATTTLAYTFKGVSIVFMMLLMRGGVLIIAPIVDRLSGRDVRWFSWAALGFSLAALLVAFSEKGGYKITIIATLDVFFYLMSYLFRLRFMSKLAKSKDVRLNTRFFVEEQMVATPSLILILGVLALVGQGEQMMQLRAGFTSFFGSEYLWIAIVIGILSQGTGVFGGLILLGKQENTFCVPVNRSSSILAGVIAGLSLTHWFGQTPTSTYQLIGAGLIIMAILFLSVPSLFPAKSAQPAKS
ncbi:MAG: hypothetical protein KC609_18985 [Myxococcales bacterium]|nr:hypothetical protein [Myxococcales bacterium]